MQYNAKQETHGPHHSPEQQFLYHSLSNSMNIKNIVKLAKILIYSRIWQYIKQYIERSFNSNIIS